MAGLPWYAHIIEKYERSTAHLTIVQHGAYRLMLDHYYKKAAPLPAELQHLFRICRAFAEPEQQAVSSVLAEFFVLRDGGWHNDTADEELFKMAEISQKRRNAGKSGGNKTASKRQASATTLNTNLSNSSLRSELEPAKRKRSALSSLPDHVPSQDDRSAAIVFWNLKGRQDLIELVDDIARGFRDHHTAHGKRMADWSAAWRTWYGNALKFNRKDNGSGSKKRSGHDNFFAAAASFINDRVDGPEGSANSDAAVEIGRPLLPS